MLSLDNFCGIEVNAVSFDGRVFYGRTILFNQTTRPIGFISFGLCDHFAALLRLVCQYYNFVLLRSCAARFVTVFLRL